MWLGRRGASSARNMHRLTTSSRLARIPCKKHLKNQEELLRSHIHEYGHVRNRHVMFITIEHIKNIGISEFENT